LCKIFQNPFKPFIQQSNMEKVQKNDFVEIEFTGKFNNEIFDTTNPQEAKSLGLNSEVKPVIVCIGKEMFLKGLDESLDGKEIGKNYSIHLMPEKAFGKRNPQLIRTMPLRLFREKNLNPSPGMVFQFDDKFAKIISVSGGRVTVDRNELLAGKEVDYDFKILRRVNDDKEKVNAVQDFLFRQRFEFEVKDKKIIFKEKKLKHLIEILKPNFKDILDFDIEVEETKETLEIKKEAKNSKEGSQVHAPKDNPNSE
jgi:FKBP-type peptidyl-prolyl cis-trans isomerase 2